MKNKAIISSLIFSSLLLFLSSNFIFSQNPSNSLKQQPYLSAIKKFTGSNKYKDTLVRFYNYTATDSSRRVVYSSEQRVIKCEKLIWDCRYISTYLQHLNNKNDFVFITFDRKDNNITLAGFFMINKKTLKAEELRRFIIIDYKITAINVFPEVLKEYIPIEEYDSYKISQADDLLRIE